MHSLDDVGNERCSGKEERKEGRKERKKVMGMTRVMIYKVDKRQVMNSPGTLLH